MKRASIFVTSFVIVSLLLSSCQKCVPIILCPYPNPQYYAVHGNDTAYIYIPNAFSPNGDGNNDQFRAFTHNITSINYHLYNANGSQIFQSNYDSWDGTVNGKRSPVGIYAVKITATTLWGATVNLNGTVSLIGGQFLGDNSQNFTGNIYFEVKNAQYEAQYTQYGFDPTIPSGEYLLINHVNSCN